jgi:hypothetical protein
MTKTVKTATPASAPVPAADTQAQAAEARNNLFQVYPEIQKLYDSFGSPETTLATQWFDKEVSERIGKFVVLIKKLEIDELFPNFNALEKVSSLTDGGTINDKLLRALEDLCKKAFQINSRPEDEIFQTKGYRGIAIYLRNANLWDELGSDNSIITKGLKLFGLDVKAIKDCIDVERLLNELGIEE